MPDLAVPVAGGVFVLGLYLALVGALRRSARLDDALARLAGATHPDTPVSLDADTRTERMGAWAYYRLRVPVAPSTRRLLALHGQTVSGFLGEKLLLGLLGLALPAVLAGLLALAGRGVPTWPLAISLLLAILGFFWPDIALRRGEERTSSDAREALLTYFDLVVIERLSNLSASQAMASAAAMSDLPVFARIRGVLERARLEQRAPWRDLHALSGQMQLPEIADMADIMRLDEQGASLAEPMRARVAELRDAQLLRDKVSAQRLSESMTLWMVVPTMVFGLIFLVPPLLRLAGG